MIKFSLSLYTAIGEYGVFAGIVYVKSWPWFAVQTSLRMFEFLMGLSIINLSFHNVMTRNNDKNTRGVQLEELNRPSY